MSENVGKRERKKERKKERKNERKKEREKEKRKKERKIEQKLFYSRNSEWEPCQNTISDPTQLYYSITL